jgi:SPP1 family predicted phage head-tail adaptor
MNSGKLKHKIEIQNSIDVRSASGAVSGQTWNPFCYAWASIEPLSGREYFAAAATQSIVSHKITMRYRAGIKTYFRISWNNRIFNIASILNTREENRELVLYCSEVTS